MEKRHFTNQKERPKQILLVVRMDPGERWETDVQLGVHNQLCLFFQLLLQGQNYVTQNPFSLPLTAKLSGSTLSHGRTISTDLLKGHLVNFIFHQSEEMNRRG